MKEALVLLPQLGISILAWVQLVLSMNRYRGIHKLTRTDVWAFMLFLHSAFVRWIAALSIRSHIVYQLSSSLIAATLSWTSFVVVYNEDFVLPTRQQAWALLMSLAITGLWELNNRIVFNL
jgi:hypothetical protein